MKEKKEPKSQSFKLVDKSIHQREQASSLSHLLLYCIPTNVVASWQLVCKHICFSQYQSLLTTLYSRMGSLRTLAFGIALHRTFLRNRCTLSNNHKSTMSVKDLRVNYSKVGLDESKLPASPLPLFASWVKEACETEQPEPNAMCLSTTSADGRPSARMVLLKGYDERGFVWYTNYESRKAEELGARPFAALTFWWAGLERSVRIEGAVVKVEEGESDDYFASRPPTSRLGAWASDQSRDVSGRDVLEKRWEDLQKTHLSDDGDVAVEISRPEHWGGYRLVPDKIEFWKGRESRLHDRILYERTPASNEISSFIEMEDEWKQTRLQP